MIYIAYTSQYYIIACYHSSDCLLLNIHSQESDGGLYLCLSTFLGFCQEHVHLHVAKTANRVFIHLKKNQKVMYSANNWREGLHGVGRSGDTPTHPFPQDIFRFRLLQIMPSLALSGHLFSVFQGCISLLL